VLADASGKEAPSARPADGIVEKRPVGIVVIGILLLLSGISGASLLAGLVMPPPSAEVAIEQLKERTLKMSGSLSEEDRAKMISTFDTEPAIQDMIKAQSEFTKSANYKVMAASSGIIGLISLIAGIGLLMSKEWARKLAIAVELLTIPVYALNFFITKSSFESFIATHMAGAQKAIPVLITVQAVIALGIVWIIISYLCRPYVKKWFA